MIITSLVDLIIHFDYAMQMNKNGTISDAVDYINELLVEKQTLEDELSGINEIECRAEEEAVRVSSKLNMNVNNEVSNTEIISIRPVDHIHISNSLIWFLVSFR